MKKNWSLIISLLSGVTILLLCIVIFFLYHSHPSTQEQTTQTIKVGILHSLTGETAESEKPVVDATLFAIDQINQNGGVLGKKIEAVVADGKSDWKTFVYEAERLILEERVAVIFGGWLPATRRELEPILKKHQMLLFYPVNYGGLHESTNIIYLGQVPNQQILPGVLWAHKNLGTQFYLIGDDSVFPRSANEIIKEFVVALNDKIVGEEYLPIEVKDVKESVKKIIAAKPTVILNTLDAQASKLLAKELRRQGITPEHIPTMSFRITRIEIDAMDAQDTMFDYACWGYFENIDTELNNAFIQAFKKKYGEKAVLNDPMEAAYIGVHFWAQAVNQAKSTGMGAVRTALKSQSFHAPEGIVHLDAETLHTWRYARIGKIRFNAFTIVWESERAIRPMPYPTMFKTKDEWEKFVQSIYKELGNQWERSIKS